MKAIINPCKLQGTIRAIPSKSHAHRILIAQKLAQLQGNGSDNPLQIPSFSKDIEATKSCLDSLDSPAPRLDCGESGSTIRFMIPVTMALRDSAVFAGSGKLPQRPLSPLKEEMEAHGAAFTMTGLTGDNVDICAVSGRLRSGTYTLAGNVSSQFITGLLFALPILEGNSTLNLTTRLESAGYVDLTLDVLRDFGIEIIESANYEGLISYEIPGSQQYREPDNLKVQGDWSNASFWLACGALGGDITCTGLDMSSSQRDKDIITVLETMGARISVDGDAVRVSGGSIKAAEVSIAQTPDMAPVLSVIMAAASGTSRITDAARLKIKESDRIAAIGQMISGLGGSISSSDDSITVNASGFLDGGTVNSCNDHRIAMAAAAASCICRKPVIIEDAQAVNKSYPDFYEDFRTLGGQITKE